MVVGWLGQDALEVRPQGLLAGAVHLALGHDLELGLVALARADVLQVGKELEVGIVALVSELVTRKTKDRQLVAVLLSQGIQLNEVPDSRASEGRDVVDEDHLPLQGGEVKRLPLGGGGARAGTKGHALEVMERPNQPLLLQRG
uniref:Uncharacterized protein n=1 Tax=Eutreptiella gymnastica TaxID=73025 RepID=A0A7S1N0Y6_9EUGL